MKTSVLDLENLIAGLKLSCQTENKSPKTVEWYICFLNKFHQYLIKHGLPTNVNSINKKHIRAFILHLRQEVKTPFTNRPLSPITIKGYGRTLKVFFGWLKREEYIAVNMMAGIPISKASNKSVNTFNEEQLTKILNLCHTSNGTGYRNFTIILLLLDSGIRVSELVNIDIDDINLNEGHIRIRKAKCNKERFVPTGSLVKKALWKYINQYRCEPLTERINRLFISIHGMPLTKSGIQQMISRYGKRAGITGVRCSPQ